ncbi:hypothetical protein [Pseudomonas chlororaphis]|uniref:hypothetical protein n=1 Tax=Pseudomonas chlororaphis TaxID=587753 RepID=UPI000F56628F|nr:hypothetical protein [Pseudomonas chlororaphis]AZC94884.1 hypothetical protein C4K28_2156 [Pseudomonas chlororaphis subsp. piscium]QTT81727.1 hypothetical protein HUT29_10635 [Pseudomonas chlororaphis]
MSFSDFMTDTITVRRRTGEVIDNLKASVQSNQIFLDRSDILIEPGDLVERKMSNGGVETFDVIDPGFHEAFHGIDAHYQMKVKKLGLPEAKQRVQSITYNITGHNARINHDSVDNSKNSVNIGGELKEYLVALRQIVEAIDDEKQKRDAVEILDGVESQLALPKPSKTVVSTLLNALPHIASVSSLASAIIGAI